MVDRDANERHADGSSPLLEVQGLQTHFDMGRNEIVRAVDGVSFTVRRGETLGIVGESGSGKSVTVRSILGIVDPPGRIVSGTILFQGRNLLSLAEKEMRRVRGREIAMVFQDPSTSLNPLLTIGDQMVETIRTHGSADSRAAQRRAEEVLALVGVPEPSRALRAYPMDFSPGMIQRIMIAMAISCDPALILADEPTTNLGVTVQAQILSALAGVQERFGTGLILISHDFGVVAQVSDHIMVMYAGRAVEYGPKERLLTAPVHPYTIGLIESVPDIEGALPERLRTIPGFPPDLSDLPKGCAFAPRCTFATDGCWQAQPEMTEVEPGHWAACYNTAAVRAARSRVRGEAA